MIKTLKVSWLSNLLHIRQMQNLNTVQLQERMEQFKNDYIAYLGPPGSGKSEMIVKECDSRTLIIAMTSKAVQNLK